MFVDSVIAGATIVLVAVTGYYAWQTHETVEELKAQRDQARIREEGQRHDSILAIRHAIDTELRHVLLLTEDVQDWQAVSELNYVRLPAETWKATFNHPEAIADPIRKRLLQVYGLVFRINALADILLMTDMDKTHFRTARAQLVKQLLPVVREAIGLVEALEEPSIASA